MKNQKQLDEKQERIAKANVIIKNPQKFKICHGCESIVSKLLSICKICNAYNFEEDESFVIEKAKDLSLKPQMGLSLDDANYE